MISSKVTPAHYRYKRLVDVGEELRRNLTNEKRALVSGTLGILYRNLGRFKQAETAYKEALKIRRELAEKNPETYIPKLITTQINIARFYVATGKSEEGIDLLMETLEQGNLSVSQKATAFAAL
ncbi:tetratricopeptide repeat protein, partial [Candidatus Bathyarchaeota archaeon]|nr:tetratricopeptide repeat protein [Candidatus Bathyarchaeota archaeon]